MPTSAIHKRRRLSRADWLGLAIEVLNKGGGARLNIDDLCGELQVTKGSFYAHFENRADFVGQFVEFWALNFTETVVRKLDKLQELPADKRLWEVMRLLQHERLARYDVAVRAWATHEPVVARGVEKVDNLRFRYIRQIFKGLGFSGADLELRTRLFVVYHSSIEGMRLPKSMLDAEEELQERFKFFTRP